MVHAGAGSVMAGRLADHYLVVQRSLLHSYTVNETKSVLTQLRKGVLEYCVLALLQHGPSYGVDLAKRLGQHTALFASEGTLYPLLSRLRRQGWVESSWQESTSGPPRRYYQLTDDGRAALATFATAWGLFSQDVRDVLDKEGQ